MEENALGKCDRKPAYLSTDCGRNNWRKRGRRCKEEEKVPRKGKGLKEGYDKIDVGERTRNE